MSIPMHGACLDSWCSLESTVDIEGTSLLRHIVKQMHVKDRNLLGFYEDFGSLEKAARFVFRTDIFC